jgi:hypothetical protein
MYVPLETLNMCRMNRIASDLVVLSTILEFSPLPRPIYWGRSSHVSPTLSARHHAHDSLIPNMVLICSSSTPRFCANCIRIIVLSSRQLISYLQPVSLPVHLCAASFATRTASLFRSYRTGSAAPKAANSDLSPWEVSFASRSVSSSLALSGWVVSSNHQL